MADTVRCPHCGGIVPTSPQRSLFDDPEPIQPEHAKARRSDPDTSQVAARFPRGESQRWRVLNAHYIALTVRSSGLTDEELHQMLRDMRLNSLTTRRSELAVAGWLYDTGIRRQASGGVDQIVWQMTPGGRNAFEKGADLERRAS